MFQQRPSRPCALLGCVAIAALASDVSAGPLNPSDFASLGAFPSDPGTYTIDSSVDPPTITGPGGAINGVVSGEVAVFTFDAITVGDGMVLVARGGTRPIALLSHGDLTISGDAATGGLIDFNASGTQPGSGGYAGGVGGATRNAVDAASHGAGPGGGEANARSAGGGGGFGGAGGGIGTWGSSWWGGGIAYGDLLVALQGGSGGAGGSQADATDPGFDGGGGGGAVELGAVGTVGIGGRGIRADGARGLATPLGGGAVRLVDRVAAAAARAVAY